MSGNFTDDPGPSSGPVAAVVSLLHNSFNDSTSNNGAATQLPVVVIEEGQAVRWDWASSHCHSVSSDTGAFESGFVYPLESPEGQDQLLPGFFDYPLPDSTPALSFTHTFTQAGVYPYHCVHHQIIGMEGVVIVASPEGP